MTYGCWVLSTLAALHSGVLRGLTHATIGAVWVRRSTLRDTFTAACIPATPAPAPMTSPPVTCMCRRCQVPPAPPAAAAPLPIYPLVPSSVAITNRECALMPGAGCRPLADGRPMKRIMRVGQRASANQTESDLQAVSGVIRH